jgi:2,4-dienoyl-CoA reductase (NADPH2)
MGRALLADPQLPNKARTGRLREINRCNLCQGCVDVMTTEFNGAGCSVNPRAGKEGNFPLAPADVSKKVVVVGGGPGGLAAAMYACERGHEVILIEREEELGGIFRWASTLFARNQLFLDYLINRVNDLPIELRLGTEVNETTLKELAPDTIVLAIGGRFVSPSIPGDQQDHVVTGAAVLGLVERIRSAETTSELGLGDSIVIVGANLIGIELAELLAERGKRVHLIEPSRRMATPAGKKRREDHCKRLDRLGVPVNTGVGVKEITTRGVTLELDGGRESCVNAETVIVVGQPNADASFAEKIEGLAEHVHAIGDTTGFGLSKKAVQEAMEIAYGI